MSSKTIVLGTKDDLNNPWLESVRGCHQDKLRRWKNHHAASFLHQKTISVTCQEEWFDAYLLRSEDFMFMVMERGQPIGCIGIRYRDGMWDLYNVIRGLSSLDSAGFMSLAFNMVVVFAQGIRPICVGCEVITGNPALSWYLRNGFVIVGDDPRVTAMRYQDKVVPK